jgi:hypothetical protein
MQLSVATVKNSSHGYIDISNIRCYYLWDLLMLLTPVTTIIVSTDQIVPIATVVYLYVATMKLCSSDCYRVYIWGEYTYG